ncbi:hypothetical protein B9T62_18335 [Paenibacillus donghaensis]|uniref:Uncharacterized protein n=1 Tax=Paenibacillus donghaensis TaxID=414771 RepID=A0A2Z2KT87_9BACL|nr:hypothetical protein B9T62_18335 [Paenibacillus donghaensis]
MRRTKFDKFFDIGDLVLILLVTVISVSCFVLSVVKPNTTTPWFWGVMSVIMIIISVKNINKYKRM